MSKTILVVTLIALTILMPSALAISNWTTTLITLTVSGINYYLIPLIITEQNLVKASNNSISVNITKVSTLDTTDRTNYLNATVTGNITTPSGSIDTNLAFTNNNNGTYNYTYSFDNIGTYQLNIKVQGAPTDSVGYSLARAYIYVGKFPIYLSIVSETEYQESEEGEVSIQVEDSDGNPITGGSANLTIYYPNKTMFLNNQSMTELGLGIYYYNFTVPSVTGVYITYVNFTSGSNSDWDSKTFHVAPWTQNITSIASLTSEINETVYYINYTQFDLLWDYFECNGSANDSHICQDLDTIINTMDPVIRGGGPIPISAVEDLGLILAELKQESAITVKEVQRPTGPEITLDDIHDFLLRHQQTLTALIAVLVIGFIAYKSLSAREQRKWKKKIEKKLFASK